MSNVSLTGAGAPAPGASAAQAAIAGAAYKHSFGQRLERWLSAIPQPNAAVEIAPGYVAAARWGKSRASVDAIAVEALPPGVIVPSPVEANIAKPDDLSAAMARVLARVPMCGAGATLLIPDPAVRVFILQFDELPRRMDEALPLLRWRLKKSVPFDVEETVVSWMRQSKAPAGGAEAGEKIEIVAAVARQKIVGEYQQILEALEVHAPLVLGSTLATLPLLEEDRAALLVRMNGRSLGTAIVRGPNLCVYRSSEMPAEAEFLEPKTVLDEIFPAVAYYQDTWRAMVDSVRLAGFGEREDLFRQMLAAELKISVQPMSEGDIPARLPGAARELIGKRLEALAGCVANAES